MPSYTLKRIVANIIYALIECVYIMYNKYSSLICTVDDLSSIIFIMQVPKINH